jgi:hypothetical protein
LLGAMDQVRGEVTASVPRDGEAAVVLGCPAVGAADALALQILARDLASSGVVVETLWTNLRSLEVLATVEAMRPRAVCIAGLPPRGAVSARYLCRRLRRQFPELAIVVLALGGSGDEGTAEPALLSAGANVVVATMRAARESLLEFVVPAAAPKQVAV